jgi:hypothetical protein
MDRANNAVGRQCGLENNNLNCADRCKHQYIEGRLFGLGGVTMPRPPRRNR